MDGKQTSFKILMFPWLAYGHIFPYLELAKKLSKKNFHIYFCSTAINLASIKKSLDKADSSVSIELVELHLPSPPELPPHYHTLKNVPAHLISTLVKAFHSSRSTFSDIITNVNPDLLIYDVFQPWSAIIASSRGIPFVHFSTSGSASSAFIHHLVTHMNFHTFPYEAIRFKEYEIRNLMTQGESFRVEDPGEGGSVELSRDIILMKSIRGIEDKYTDYLAAALQKKIVSVGPLITFADDQEIADSEIMNWLNRKSQSSTLYISLGSESYFSKQQIGEIAKGLELCDVNFIWVARSPSGSDVIIEEALPEGFLDRVKHRGKIVGWAPQTAVLAHPSVGGFMSHCGWSSVTETMYFGVPLVAVPLQYDQPLNARLVVEAGIGVEVMRDENGGFSGEGVAKAIKGVMVEESGEGIRCKVRELSKKMRMEEEETFNEVVEELSRIICLKK